jgi:hypothetical protein
VLLAGTSALACVSRDVILGWVVLAAVPHAALSVAGLRGADPRAVAVVCLAAQLPAIFAVPTFSDDVFRYAWDARVLAHGIDPFAYAPDDAALRPLRDGLWARVNHPEIPTIYPLAAQILFLAGRAAVPSSPVLGIKLVLVLALHGAARVVASVRPADRAGGYAAVALQPLLCVETALDGHVDVAVGLALVGALALRSRSSVGAGALVGVAAGIKLVGFLLTPLAAATPRARRGVAVALATGALLAAPLVTAGHGSARDGGALEYARRWEGNAGAYRILEEGLTALARPGADRWGHVEAPVLRWLEGTRAHPHAQRRERKRPASATELYPDELGRWLARLVVVLLAITVAARRGAHEPRAVRDTLVVILLLSPQLHPWYLAWALPLEIAVGGWAVGALSIAALVAHTTHGAPGWLIGLEHALGWCALVLDRPWTTTPDRGSPEPGFLGGTTCTTSRFSSA